MNISKKIMVIILMFGVFSHVHGVVPIIQNNTPFGIQAFSAPCGVYVDSNASKNPGCWGYESITTSFTPAMQPFYKKGIAKKSSFSITQDGGTFVITEKADGKKLYINNTNMDIVLKVKPHEHNNKANFVLKPQESIMPSKDDMNEIWIEGTPCSEVTIKSDHSIREYIVNYDAASNTISVDNGLTK